MVQYTVDSFLLLSRISTTCALHTHTPALRCLAHLLPATALLRARTYTTSIPIKSSEHHIPHTPPTVAAPAYQKVFTVPHTQILFVLFGGQGARVRTVRTYVHDALAAWVTGTHNWLFFLMTDRPTSLRVFLRTHVVWASRFCVGVRGREGQRCQLRFAIRFASSFSYPGSRGSFVERVTLGPDLSFTRNNWGFPFPFLAYRERPRTRRRRACLFGFYDLPLIEPMEEAPPGPAVWLRPSLSSARISVRLLCFFFNSRSLNELSSLPRCLPQTAHTNTPRDRIHRARLSLFPFYFLSLISTVPSFYRTYQMNRTHQNRKKRSSLVQGVLDEIYNSSRQWRSEEERLSFSTARFRLWVRRR